MPTQIEDGALPRTIGVFGATALIVGAIVGAGIFTNPARILKDIGNPIYALFAWFLGAVIAYLGAMTYGEWASRIPLSGGDAQYLDCALPRPRLFFSYMYSCTRVLYVNPGYCAATSLAFARYFLIACIPDLAKKLDERWPIKIRAYEFAVATILLFLQTLACSISNRLSGRVLLGFTLLAVGVVSLIAFCGFLFPVVSINGIVNAGNFKREHWSPSTVKWSNAAVALMKVLWAYDGWSNLASSAGEILSPQKNIFRANLFGIGLVALIYMFTNVAFLYIVPMDDFADPAFGFAKRIPFLAHNSYIYVVAAAVMASTFSCSLVSIFSASRIAQATADQGMVPAAWFLRRINKRFGTPINSLWATCGLSIAYAALNLVGGDAFTVLVTMVSYQFWFFCTVVLFGLLVVKYREGALLRWRRDPRIQGVQVYFLSALTVGLAGLFLCVYSFFSSNGPEDVVPQAENNAAADKQFISDQVACGVSLALILLCAVPYYIRHRQQLKRSKFAA